MAEAAAVPARTDLKRHELWRQAYRKKRFMEYLDEQSLWQRGQEILLNLVTLTEAGKLGVLDARTFRASFSEKWTEFLEECALRGLSYPPPASFVRCARIPDVASDLCRNASRAVARVSGLPSRVLVKYSKAKYLREALATDDIRVAPASSYNDPSLNQAQRDNELMKVVAVAPIDVGLHNVATAETRTIKVMSEFGYALQADYYVYCMSCLLLPRLFYDFDADACLIVREPDRFFKEMATAAGAALPGWTYGFGDVTYLDPLVGEPVFQTPVAPEQLFSSKHFRFFYQAETRLIWAPPQPTGSLQPVFLHLPDLGSYATLLEL